MKALFLFGCLSISALAAEDVVILDDVDGKEVHIRAEDLIRAYQKYTAQKAKELKANAPLEVHGVARTYAARELYMSTAEADRFADQMAERSDGKAVVNAHRAWYLMAKRVMYLDTPAALRLADEKCGDPNSLELKEAYEKNYLHAIRVLYKDRPAAQRFAEEMLKKVGQSEGDANADAVPPAGRRR